LSYWNNPVGGLLSLPFPVSVRPVSIGGEESIWPVVKSYSVSWIGKVISRHKFFFNTRQPVRRKRRSLRGKNRIKYCPKQKNIRLGYLQMDCVHVVFEGKNYYFICAIELQNSQPNTVTITKQTQKDGLCQMWVTRTLTNGINHIIV